MRTGICCCSQYYGNDWKTLEVLGEGGIAKEHSNERDLDKARQFYQNFQDTCFSNAVK